MNSSDIELTYGLLRDIASKHATYVAEKLTLQQKYDKAQIAYEHSQDRSYLPIMWNLRDRIQESKRTAIIRHDNNTNCFRCEVATRWKSDAIIYSPYTGERLSGEPLGLRSEISVDSAYENGYHNSDCGQDNSFYLINSSLIDLIFDLHKFFSHTTLQEVPIDEIIKASAPRLMEDILLRGD